METNNSVLKFLKVDKLIENISKYIEARFELIKLDVQEEVAGAIVKVVQLGLLLFLFLFTITFASLGLANYLNYVIESNFAGYLIVAAFYLVLALVVKASKGPIQAKVEKMTGNMFQKKDEPEVTPEMAHGISDINRGIEKPNLP